MLFNCSQPNNNCKGTEFAPSASCAYFCDDGVFTAASFFDFTGIIFLLASVIINLAGLLVVLGNLKLPVNC